MCNELKNHGTQLTMHGASTRCVHVQLVMLQRTVIVFFFFSYFAICLPCLSEKHLAAIMKRGKVLNTENKYSSTFRLWLRLRRNLFTMNFKISPAPTAHLPLFSLCIALSSPFEDVTDTVVSFTVMQPLCTSKCRNWNVYKLTVPKIVLMIIREIIFSQIKKFLDFNLGSDIVRDLNGLWGQQS